MTTRVHNTINMPKDLPTLETERLRLVSLNMNHTQALFEMRQNPEHHKYTDTLPDQTLEETQRYIDKMTKGVMEGKWLIWGIEAKASGNLVGTISLWQFDQMKKTAELGFGLTLKEHHKGYMSEAVSAVLTYGFEILYLSEILAYTEENNSPSIHLLEKMDFEQSDCIQENGYLVDKTFIMRVYRVRPGREAHS